MPSYTYKCQCRAEPFEQYLRENKSTKILKCQNCGRNVSARQVYDNSIQEQTQNGVTGYVRSNKSS